MKEDLGGRRGLELTHDPALDTLFYSLSVPECGQECLLPTLPKISCFLSAMVKWAHTLFNMFLSLKLKFPHVG